MMMFIGSSEKVCIVSKIGWGVLLPSQQNSKIQLIVNKFRIYDGSFI